MNHNDLSKQGEGHEKTIGMDRLVGIRRASWGVGAQRMGMQTIRVKNQTLSGNYS